MKVKIIIIVFTLALSLVLVNELRYKALEVEGSVVTLVGQCEGDFFCVDVEPIEDGSQISIYNQNTVNLLRIDLGKFMAIAQDVRSKSWDMIMTKEEDKIVLTIHARFRGDLTYSTKTVEVNEIFYALFPFEGAVSFRNERQIFRLMIEFNEALNLVGEATTESPFIFYHMKEASDIETAFYVGEQSYYIMVTLKNTHD